MRYLAASVLATAAIVVPAHAQAPDWTQVTSAGNPNASTRYAMAWDSAGQKIVLFGGATTPGSAGSAVRNETWEYDGVAWTQLTTANSPMARTFHVMAYDSARQKMVVFGGSNPAPSHDTWEYDGSDWTQMTTSGFPSNRTGHAMVYDSARQKMVLFGGSGSSLFNETWEYDGAAWTQITTANSPAARLWHTMVYDSARSRVVLFGGADSPSNYFNDTWEYDGSDWAQVATASNPAVRGRHAMAYDNTRQRVVVFGGRDSSTNNLNDTWEFDGVTWTQVATPNSPSARQDHGMVYDSARGQMVMYGGSYLVPWSGGGPPTGPTETLLSDTWELGGVPPVLSGVVTYGTGCGSPSLGLTPVASQPPVIGATASCLIGPVPPPQIAAVSLGFSNSVYNGIPLPIDLSVLGMTGCWQLQSNEALVVPVAAGPATSAMRFDLPIPNSAIWLSVRIYVQGLCLAPGANALGAITSNAIEWTFGNS